MDWKKVSKVVVFLVLVLSIGFVLTNDALRSQLTVSHIQSFVASSGVWGPIVYMLAYVVGMVLFLPGTVLTLSAGFLFGTALGTVYTVIGATLGAAAAFVFSRYIGGEFVTGLVKDKFSTLDGYNTKLKENGFATMFILRLFPIFPFNGLNYAMGLTKIRFKDYFLGTLLGIIPGTFVYVNIGANVADWKSPGFFIAVGLLVLLMVVGVVWKKYKN